MRDRTALFLQAVTALSAAATAVGETDALNGQKPLLKPQRSILKPISAQGTAPVSVLGRCRSALKTLEALNAFMLENASKYLASLSVAVPASSLVRMSDPEKDLFDKEVSSTLLQCRNSIFVVKTELNSAQKKSMTSEQHFLHCLAMITFLEEYSNHIAQRHGRWKLERLQQRVDQRSSYINRPVSARHTATVQSEQDLSVNSDQSNDDGSSPAPPRSSESAQEADPPSMISGSHNASALMGAVLEPDEDLHFSSKTQELLIEENQQLERQLHTMVDQIKQVESQMSTIAQAHAFISSNIAQTKEELELIHSQATDVQANFSVGNVNLQQAAQSGVKFRIFVLVFLLTLSISLLILHWTYD